MLIRKSEIFTLYNVKLILRSFIFKKHWGRSVLYTEHCTILFTFKILLLDLIILHNCRCFYRESGLENCTEAWRGQWKLFQMQNVFNVTTTNQIEVFKETLFNYLYSQFHSNHYGYLFVTLWLNFKHRGDLFSYVYFFVTFYYIEAQFCYILLHLVILKLQAKFLL